jgi:very-short-patch-repair endonuclease
VTDSNTPPLDPLPQAGGEDAGRPPRKVLFRERPTARAQELRRSLTDAERRLWRHLSRRQLGGWKFSRQMPVGPFVCDFLCREAKLVVEVDGGQHDLQQARDAARSRFLKGEGYRVIRFWNHDVLGNVEGVLLTILSALEASPPACGRGLRGGVSDSATRSYPNPTPGPSREREGR